MKNTLGGRRKGEGGRGKAEGERRKGKGGRGKGEGERGKGNEQVISKRYCLVHRPLIRSGKAMGVRELGSPFNMKFTITPNIGTNY